MKFKIQYSLFNFFLCILLFTGNIYAQRSFEMVILPDTQTYIEEYPEVFESQMKWLASNQNRFTYVLHVGDVTQNNSEEEWIRAVDGFSLIKNKIPYSIAIGNHDMGSEDGKFADTRNTEKANRYFPLESYAEQTKVIASFPEGTIDNLCTEFEAGGIKWLVLSLEFGPRNKTVDWANQIIKKNPNHKVIINTHAYLFYDNTFLDGNDWALPQNYGVGKLTGDDAVNDGSQLWEKLVSQHKNILFVFTGHITGTGVATLVSQGVHNNKVYQMLANYQKGVKGFEKGDSGYLRIIKVDINSQIISVKTYSPWLDRFNTVPEQEFIFEQVQF